MRILLLWLMMFAALAGCVDTVEEGAATGGLGGAAVGALAGGPIGAAIGAGVGAAGGVGVQKAEERQRRVTPAESR